MIPSSSSSLSPTVLMEGAYNHGRDGMLLQRRNLLQAVVVAATATIITTTNNVAYADVSSGDVLPEGAAQFSRIIRIKEDIKGVRKRVLEYSSEIDKKEWDNISKFTRNIYTSSQNDMKSIANGITDPTKKQRALDDIIQLQRYLQAGDIPIQNKDGKNFIAVLDKVQSYLDDYFDALSDVPDEI